MLIDTGQLCRGQKRMSDETRTGSKRSPGRSEADDPGEAKTRSGIVASPRQVTKMAGINHKKQKEHSMPLPIVPLIGAGASLAGGIASNASTARQNSLNRQWQERVYERQRKDALTDRDFENFYNSPAEQMKRLKEAGLNPNLVYGNGNATEASASARSSNMGSPEFRPANWTAAASGLSSSFMDIYDMQQKQAQTDNVKAATDLARQQLVTEGLRQAQIAAGTAKTSVDTESSKFGLDLARDLRDTSLEAAKANLQHTVSQINKANAETTRTGVETGISLARNEREALMNAQNLKKGLEEILQIRANTAKSYAEKSHIEQVILNLKKDETLKQLDINLRKLGINPSDPTWQRAAAQFVKQVVDMKPEEIRQGLKEAIKNFLPGGGFGIIK